MIKGCTDEKNIQILLALLKAHGIKRIIASPGSTNHTMVSSAQAMEDFFEMYSCVDERSAAYMACGLAAETGEPVVITCTEATASRNYMPGLTEAYYRKLPVLAICTTHGRRLAGQHIAQVLDHSVVPNDVALKNIFVPVCHNDADCKYAELKINEAILELSHRGGGPVYLNMETLASKNYPTKELPSVRVINRYTYGDVLPPIPMGRIGVFIGSHKLWSKEETEVLDKFCEVNNAVAFCDHTSGYKGKYRVDYSIVGGQEEYSKRFGVVDLVIHIGEVTGDYFSTFSIGTSKLVWRVSEDGELRDTFGKLIAVFEMKEQHFFKHYSEGKTAIQDHIIAEYKEHCKQMRGMIEELPFSNIWIANKLTPIIPDGAVMHFSILSSLRSWDLFELPETVLSNSNVGGFGIDGGVSSFIGASLAHPDKLYLGVFGDLAFFYDLNSIGNRHIGSNIRIMLINNGKGAEFRLYWHPASLLGEDADGYITAAGHNGNQSRSLMKGMAEALGFEYISASSKEEFEQVYEKFISPNMAEKPLFFEVFTEHQDESDALYHCRHLVKDPFSMKTALKNGAKKILGDEIVGKIKNAMK